MIVLSSQYDTGELVRHQSIIRGSKTRFIRGKKRRQHGLKPFKNFINESLWKNDATTHVFVISLFLIQYTYRKTLYSGCNNAQIFYLACVTLELDLKGRAVTSHSTGNNAKYRSSATEQKPALGRALLHLDSTGQTSPIFHKFDSPRVKSSQLGDKAFIGRHYTPRNLHVM